LSGDLTGRSVLLPDKVRGIVVAHRPPIAFVYTGEQSLESREGSARILNQLETISIDHEKCNVVDCFGNARKTGEKDTDTVSTTTANNKRAIYAPIPQVKDIALINTPLVTGVTMFEALSPIGNGQNMLMIGHDLEDMRGYVRDILSAQKQQQQSKTKKLKCVYAVTENADAVQQSLAEAGLLDDVTLVVPRQEDASLSPSAKAAEAVTICAAACAIGEIHALEHGEDALVIIDTIDQQKLLWGITTQVLVDVFGVEAVVQSDREGGASSEMRAFYSSLIQRSAQYKKKRGGGSVTLVMLTTIPKMAGADDDEDRVFAKEDFDAMGDKLKERISMLVDRKIPLTAATLRKVNIPIPSDAEGRRRLVLQHVDDLISMSDGQLWFDEDLEAAGRRPPMDPQRSVTRVGIGADTQSRADAPALRRIVEGLRLDLAQAASMDGAEVNTAASIKQIRKTKALLLAMHQPSGMGGRTLSESCTAILAASNGHLDAAVDAGVAAGSDEGTDIVRRMLEYVRENAPEALAEVDGTLDMTDAVRSDIDGALTAFFAATS